MKLDLLYKKNKKHKDDPEKGHMSDDQQKDLTQPEFMARQMAPNPRGAPKASGVDMPTNLNNQNIPRRI